MFAYPSVLTSQLQAQVKRKQQKEETFVIHTDTYELDNSHVCDWSPWWFLLQG